MMTKISEEINVPGKLYLLSSISHTFPSRTCRDSHKGIQGGRDIFGDNEGYCSLFLEQDDKKRALPARTSAERFR